MAVVGGAAALALNQPGEANAAEGKNMGLYSPYGGLPAFGAPAMGLLRRPGMPFGDPSNPQNLPYGLLGQPSPAPAVKPAMDDGEEDKPAATAAPVSGSVPTPPPRPVDLTPQQPAQAPQAVQKEEPGFFGGLLDRLGNIYGNGGAGDALISLGAGLMSSPGNVGKGLIAGMELANKSRLMGAQGEMARNKLAGQNATAKLIADRMGIPYDQAQGLVASGGASTALSQIFQPKQPQLVDVQLPDGSTQKQWITPGQAGGVSVGAAKAKDDDIQKVDITKPDGTTQPAWVKRGENNVQYIGPEQQAPTGAIPAGVDPAKYREEMAKKAATQEAAKVERTRAAETAMPHLDRATKAYETLANLGAIGPMSASGMSRLWGGMKGSKDEIARQDFEAAAKELELMKSQISMKGQGTITDGERKILALTLPRLDAADPKTGLETLRMMRDSFKKDFGGKVEADPAQQQQPQAPLNGARKAPDGNWYIKQGDKWHKVVQ